MRPLLRANAPAPRADARPSCSTPARRAHPDRRRYGSEALAHSAALLGSLQLLGNPAAFLRSLAAGLTDALALPLRGLSGGPGHFLVGLGAGASSLFLHASHGVLTSVTAASLPRGTAARGRRA